MPSLSARDYVQAKRGGRATAVRVQPTGTAVTDYQVSLGQRHSLKEAGVIGLPSWSDRATQTETWAKVPRLSATCPKTIIAYEGGRGDGTKTFDLFDDFNGTSVNTALWDTTGSIVVSGGIATLPNVAEAALWSKNAHKGSIVGTSFSVASQTNYHACILVGDYCGIGRHVSDGNLKFLDAAAAYGNTLQALAYNEWVRYEVQFSANVVRARKVLDTPIWSTWNHTPALTKTAIGPFSVNAVANYKFVYVRKYVANEPLAGTAQPTATNRALSRPLNHAGLIRACCAA